MAKCRKSILLFADSGEGKTAQIGELAEYLYRTEGKKTRLYAMDPGGWDTIQPQVNLGIVDVVDCFGPERPFEQLHYITQGAIPDGPNKWKPGKSDDIGLYAFEGITAACDDMMQFLAAEGAAGKNIGGGTAISFSDGTIKVGGNNQAHYGIVQSNIYKFVTQSQRLGGAYVLWTAAARRADDNDSKAVILGPQAAGKALTSEIPRWFSYTWRLLSIPDNPITKAKGEHRLYFHDHLDQLTPGAKVLGNDRLPLDADPLPAYIAPASVVKALLEINKRTAAAEAKIAARIADVAPAQAPVQGG